MSKDSAYKGVSVILFPWVSALADIVGAVM